MMNLIMKYPTAFAAALLLHIVAGVIFTSNFQISDKAVIEPEVDVIQATAINEEQVLAELAALKAAEAKKRQAEHDRLTALSEDADRLKKQREKEQKRLRDLEKKRKQEQAKQKKLEKERKLAEKRQREADKKQKIADQKRRDAEKKRKVAEREQQEAEKKRKVAERKQQEADKKRRLAEKTSREAEQRRVKELEKRRLAEEKRKKAEAEQKRAEEMERKAKAKAVEEQQRLEDAKARQRELADEERRLAASRDKKVHKIVNRYKRLIQKQVKNNWRMRNAKPGSRCDVFVRMMPTGDVLQVEAKNCVGGKLFKRSVEDAVRAAAPLPLPPDKSLFSQFREIEFKFDPKH